MPRRPPQSMSRNRARMIVNGQISGVSAAEAEEARRIVQGGAGSSTGKGQRGRGRRGGARSRSGRRPEPALRTYAQIPEPNGRLELGGGKWLVRFTIPATVLPKERESRDDPMDVDLDIVVEYDPKGRQPDHPNARPLHVQTADGKHTVVMKGHGVANLTVDAERVFNGRRPHQGLFNCVVTPWREFEGARSSRWW